MTIPPRGSSEHGTFFVTASTFRKMPLLQSDRSAGLFIDVLLHYREQHKYLLHAFVVMPDHFHLLLTPATDVTLERAIQLIKGAFSFRRKQELELAGEVWQTSFYDHRVRDGTEFQQFCTYIHENPVRKGLAAAAQTFTFSSANPAYVLDEVPQRLKPLSSSAANTQA